MSIDKGTIVLSVFIIIIVQWSEINYKFYIVQRMYIVLYVRTESLNNFSCISNIFHWMSFTFMVPNVQNVQENLNLWQTKWKQMELSPFISANFVHLFLVFKPTIVKHCIQFFVWELIISLLLDQKLKAASFSFGTSECWIGIQAVSKVERKQDSGLFLLRCWKGDCLINCLQIFASRGKNWQKTWSSAAQNITTPDTTQQ